MHVAPHSTGNRSQPAKVSSASNPAASVNPRRRSVRHGWFAMPLVAIALSGGLVACGSDSTVENNAKSSGESSVPSVSSSATSSSAEPSESDAPSDSSAAESSSSGESPAVTAPDGSVREVDEVPAGEGRTREDEDFLKELTDKGVDFNKAGGKNASANLQDQVLAAARASCQEHGDDRIQNYLPMAAGQLQAQGVVDKPEEAAKVIQDAAKKVYCK